MDHVLLLLFLPVVMLIRLYRRRLARRCEEAREKWKPRDYDVRLLCYYYKDEEDDEGDGATFHCEPDKVDKRPSAVCSGLPEKEANGGLKQPPDSGSAYCKQDLVYFDGGSGGGDDGCSRLCYAAEVGRGARFVRLLLGCWLLLHVLCFCGTAGRIQSSKAPLQLA